MSRIASATSIATSNIVRAFHRFGGPVAGGAALVQHADHGLRSGEVAGAQQDDDAVAATLEHRHLAELGEVVHAGIRARVRGEDHAPGRALRRCSRSCDCRLAAGAGSWVTVAHIRCVPTPPVPRRIVVARAYRVVPPPILPGGDAGRSRAPGAARTRRRPEGRSRAARRCRRRRASSRRPSRARATPGRLPPGSADRCGSARRTGRSCQRPPVPSACFNATATTNASRRPPPTARSRARRSPQRPW